MDFFIETSAKTGMNAQEIFIQAAKVLYQDYSLYRNEKKNKEEKEKDIINNEKLKDKTEEKKNKKCC